MKETGIFFCTKCTEVTLIRRDGNCAECGGKLTEPKTNTEKLDAIKAIIMEIAKKEKECEKTGHNGTNYGGICSLCIAREASVFLKIVDLLDMQKQ